MINRLVLSFVLTTAAGVAAAQSPGDSGGRVTAFACQALPSPLRVEVDRGDGTPESERLRGVLVRALAQRQVVVVPGAPFRLSLYVDSVREPETRKGRDLGRFSRGNASDERTKFHINLWSNRKDSVIGGRRDDLLSAKVDELHVEITLDSLADGQCVWQGEAVHMLEGRDEVVAAERIIPHLIERLGRSARAERIDLD